MSSQEEREKKWEELRNLLRSAIQSDADAAGMTRLLDRMDGVLQKTSQDPRVKDSAVTPAQHRKSTPTTNSAAGGHATTPLSAKNLAKLNKSQPKAEEKKTTTGQPPTPSKRSPTSTALEEDRKAKRKSDRTRKQ